MIALHPMMQEVTAEETKHSVQTCNTLLDSLQQICLRHGKEVSYYKQLFQTIKSVIVQIENDDMMAYLRFLEDVFPYIESYRYYPGMELVLDILSALLKDTSVGAVSDQALLLSYSDTSLDYASVQEAMGCICLTMGEVQQATSHFQKAMEIYKNVFEFEPDMVETKKQELLIKRIWRRKNNLFFYTIR